MSWSAEARAKALEKRLCRYFAQGWQIVPEQWVENRRYENGALQPWLTVKDDLDINDYEYIYERRIR